MSSSPTSEGRWQPSGEPEASYGPAKKLIRHNVIMWGLLLLVGVFICVVSPLAITDPPNPAVAYGLVYGIGGAMALGGVYLLWSSLSKSGWKVDFFKEGFVAHMGGKTVQARWNEVAGLEVEEKPVNPGQDFAAYLSGKDLAYLVHFQDGRKEDLTPWLGRNEAMWRALEERAGHG
jgi:hypothetical protein